MESITLIATISVLAVMAIIFVGGIFMTLSEKEQELDEVFNKALEEEQERDLQNKMRDASMVEIEYLNPDGSLKETRVVCLYQLLSSEENIRNSKVVREIFREYGEEIIQLLTIGETLSFIIALYMEGEVNIKEADLNMLLYTFLEVDGEKSYDLFFKAVEKFINENK